MPLKTRSQSRRDLENSPPCPSKATVPVQLKETTDIAPSTDPPTVTPNPFEVPGILVQLSTLGKNGPVLPTQEWVEYACSKLGIKEHTVNGIRIRRHELFEELCHRDPETCIRRLQKTTHLSEKEAKSQFWASVGTAIGIQNVHQNGMFCCSNAAATRLRQFHEEKFVRVLAMWDHVRERAGNLDNIRDADRYAGGFEGPLICGSADTGRSAGPFHRSAESLTKLYHSLVKYVLQKKGLEEAARVQNVFCLLHSTWDNERRMDSGVSSVDRMLAQSLSSRKEDDPDGLHEEFEDWLSLVAVPAGTDPFYMSIIKYVLGVLCKVLSRTASDSESYLSYHPTRRMASLLYSTFADIYELSREPIHEGSRQIFEYLLDAEELQCHPLSGEYKLLDGTGGEAFIYQSGAYVVRKIKLDNRADSKKKDKYLELKRFRAVLMEAALLKPLRHMNVIAFRGLYRHEGAWCLMSDYHQYGNAMTFLDASETRHAEIPRLIYGISVGLRHIHNLGVIHGDLHARNILVKATQSGSGAVIYDAVICDFGFSRLEDYAALKTELSEKKGHIAPELHELRSQNGTTFASDHFACGSTFYELIENKSPPAPPYVWKPMLHLPPQDGQRSPKETGTRYLTKSRDRSVERWLIPLIREMWASDPDFKIVRSRRLLAATKICERLEPFGRVKGARK